MRKLNLVVGIILLGLVARNSGEIQRILRTFIQSVLTFCTSTNGKITAYGVAMVIVLVIIREMWGLVANIQQHKRRQMAILKLTPSTDRGDYIIEKDDYRRGSPKENYYRKTFCLYLLEAFSNSCAKCGSKENGMDIDHFIFSKNEGGCFIMKHKGGYLVNNAVPLCQTCNRSKSDDDYKTFFSESELLVILEKNVTMTDLLNKRSIFPMKEN